ncbi:MAG: hypothetical protein Kow0029_30000 [Candidatus Rifleibacteriota bacterium]
MKKILLLALFAFVLFQPVFAGENNFANPWEEFFPDGLIDADNNVIPIEHLEGKIVGLYFSASWCRGCCSFSREFVPFRNKHSDKFEVVLVGFDYSAAEMASYMKNYKMKWTAIPWDSPSRLAMKEKYQISEIPTLIIFSPNGKIITMDGHQEVMTMGDEAITHWEKMAAEMK